MADRAAVWEQEDLLQHALDRVNDGILMLDRDWVCTYVNAAGAALVDRAVDSLLGRQIWAEFPTAVDSVFGHRFREAMETGQPVFFEEFFATVQAWFALRVFPSSDGLTIYYQDVTVRRRAEDHLRVLNRLYLTLAQTNQAIARATDEQSLYAAVCRIIVESGGFLGAWVGERTYGGDVQVAAVRGATEEYVRNLRLTADDRGLGGVGPTAVALRSGEPVFTGDFLNDPITAPWHATAAGYGIAASATLPLRCRERIVAVLTIYSAVRDVFTPDTRLLLEGVAGNLSFALESLDAAARLRESVVERGELLQRLVVAQEMERARIAADVHDEPVQALAAAGLRVQVLQDKLHASVPGMDGEVRQVQQTLAFATQRLRDLLFDLEPVGEDVELAEALRAAAEHMLRDRSLHWTVTAGDAPQLPQAALIQAVRITQEALANVRQHARASTVTIAVEPGAGGVQVCVADDGVGVGQDEWVSPPGHRGLTTMRDRAAVAGGWLRLESAPGGGTLVRLWLPTEPA